MVKKKITILLPVHQRADIELNFDETIQSILKNIDNNFILNILIDGKLNKKFEKKIRNYRVNSKFKNIVVTKSSKVGLSKLLNIGIKQAQTEWIARADSDDIYTKYYFKEGLKLTQFKKNQPDLFGGQIVEFHTDQSKYLTKTVPLSQNKIISLMRFRNPFNHMTVFFKTSIAKKLGGYPDYYLKEDYALWVKFINSGAKVMNSNKIFAYARTGEDFYKRRKGLKHIYSEYKLQKLLYINNVSNLFLSIIVFSVRVLLILMPSVIIKGLYLFFLRK